MNVILFGATGMVGQGVLRECLLRSTFINVAVLMFVMAPAVHAQSPAPKDPAPAANLQGDKSHPPAPETLKLLQGMTNWDHAPAMPLNPQGLHLRFAQFDKRKTANDNAVVYRAYASGAPTGQRYSLVSWTVGEPLQSVVAEVWLNERGLLMCSKPTSEQQNADSVSEHDEINLVIQAGKGEPKRFALVSEDQKLLVPGTLVPYPIEAKDKACSVQALLASPHGEAFLLQGSGFPRQTTVNVESISAGERQTGNFQSSVTGELTATVFPFVEGKDSGVAEVHLSTPDCKLDLKLPWGKDSYHIE